MLVRFSNVIYWLCSSVAAISFAAGVFFFISLPSESEVEALNLTAKKLADIAEDYKAYNKGVLVKTENEHISKAGEYAALRRWGIDPDAIANPPKPGWIMDRSYDAWLILFALSIFGASVWLFGRTTRYVFAGR